jgi:hypothetical protein
MMSEDERFGWELLGLTALLGVCVMLHSSMIRLLTDKMIAVSADVEFLKDHTVARETEARP